MSPEREEFLRTYLGEPHRQTGTTTKQMREAPLSAVYVWCNSKLLYPLKLACTLGRGDLRIVSPGWIQPSNVTAVRVPIVIDHAADLDDEAFYMVRRQNDYLLKRSWK